MPSEYRCLISSAFFDYLFDDDDCKENCNAQRNDYGQTAHNGNNKVDETVCENIKIVEEAVFYACPYGRLCFRNTLNLDILMVTVL